MGTVQIVWGRVPENMIDIYDSYNIQSLFDEKRNFNLEFILEGNKEQKSFFIAHEDYGFVKEFFYEQLPVIVNTLFNNRVIDRCVVQNPPKLLLESFKRNFEAIEYVHFEYESIDDGKFFDINTSLNKRILGQEVAIKELLSALYLAKSKISNKPLVVMLYGPEGVGKTETAKIISESIHKNSMFRKQLSMFQTNDSMVYMFGDIENQNSFARDLLLRNSNIILLDEFDKVPSVFYSAFYQLFDEGIFVDRNYEVNMKNTIIICTSNYNSRDEIREFLGGPIYSRFDAIIQYVSLSTEIKERIIKESYKKNLELFSEGDAIIIESANLLEKLIERAASFKNVREIDKFIKLLMAKKCVEKLLG